MKSGKIYYTAKDYGEDKIIETTERYINSNLDVLSATGTSKQVGNTTMLEVILKWTTQSEGVTYPIKKVYYNEINDGTDMWIEVDDFKYEDSQISFVMYESGEYKFKIEDTSGAVAETVTTITF